MDLLILIYEFHIDALLNTTVNYTKNTTPFFCRVLVFLLYAGNRRDQEKKMSTAMINRSRRGWSTVATTSLYIISVRGEVRYSYG